MKKLFRRLIYIHFYIMAKLVLFFKKPYIILFVWWENKAFLKEKFKTQAIKAKFDIWEKQKPYNTCFGINLTILNSFSAYGDVWWWFGIYFMSFFKFIKALFSYPRYLFLEWWIDESWEAKTFLGLFRPKVIVFGNVDHSFNDDTATFNIIEKEFGVLVSYLNSKSEWYEDIQKQWNIEEIIDLIKNWERYFGEVAAQNERIQDVVNKLIRKTKLIP